MGDMPAFRWLREEEDLGDRVRPTVATVGVLAEIRTELEDLDLDGVREGMPCKLSSDVLGLTAFPVLILVAVETFDLFFCAAGVCFIFPIGTSAA
eukprot:752844-Hanusia_phi.AAC.2